MRAVQEIAEPIPRRVLIVKPSALGDVVTAMPILRALRRTFPDAHIAWLVAKSCLELIEHDSDLDECVIFDRSGLGLAWRSVRQAWRLAELLHRLRTGRYDWVLDLQGLLRSGLLAWASRAPLRAGFCDAREGAAWFYTHSVVVQADEHTVDRNIALARELGVAAKGEDITLQISPAAGEFAASFAGRHGLASGFLICVPPTRWSTKQYPLRHWRQVVAGLARHAPVVLLGAAGDTPLCQEICRGLGPGVINAAGQTGVSQMVALIHASRGVVCCDSAAKFIAAAVGTDVVVLIGPTRLSRTGPYLRGRALVADVPCQGCLKRRCRHITCMQLIEPNEVISAAEKMLVGGRN